MHYTGISALFLILHKRKNPSHIANNINQLGTSWDYNFCKMELATGRLAKVSLARAAYSFIAPFYLLFQASIFLTNGKKSLSWITAEPLMDLYFFGYSQ